MSLADQIIEHGPYDATIHPRYGAETYLFTGASLNGLRDELIAGRALKELLGRYSTEAVSLSGAPTDLSLHCDRCNRWTAHIDRPQTLDELAQRAAEHAEVCR